MIYLRLLLSIYSHRQITPLITNQSQKNHPRLCISFVEEYLNPANFLLLHFHPLNHCDLSIKKKLLKRMSLPSLPYLRTPDGRSEHLPNFPYEPSYYRYGNLRMAYVDEKAGNRDQVFLCLHGQPTWSYLYRKMIPVLLGCTTTGRMTSHRVVAPDLFGFGRSDKPSKEQEYSFNIHRYTW